MLYVSHRLSYNPLLDRSFYSPNYYYQQEEKKYDLFHVWSTNQSEEQNVNVLIFMEAQ